MNEFIDKLIERLEEESNNAEAEMHILADSEYSLPCQFDRIDIEDCKSKTFCEAISIVNELAEEYKLSEMPTGSESFCEWKKGESSVFPIKTNCGNSMDVNYGYEFCPYCGKKIKVATYTEGE